MTKTLTEQWRDGTLKTGSYYIRIITGNEKSDYFEGKKFCFWNDYEVEEVLAPVPSYDKVKEMSQKVERLEFDNEVLDMSYSQAKEITIKLEKQLAIATKALKEYERCENGSYAKKALVLIKEVK